MNKKRDKTSPAQYPFLASTPGYCACGCGQKTSIAMRNRPDRGIVKGQPLKYVVGHSHRFRGGPAVPLGMRWCGKCKTTKPSTDFYASHTLCSGLQSICKSCNTKIHRQWRTKNRSKSRFYALKHRLLQRYNMSLEEYQALLDKHNHVCAICGQPERTSYNGIPKLMSVDHDHTTGKIRGILCNNCNRALGLIGDNPEFFQKALAYLEH